MFDLFTCIIFFFLLGFLVLIILVGIQFFHNLANVGQSNNSCSEEIDKELIEDSKEDSQADGLLLFDDPLFPEEPDDDY